MKPLIQLRPGQKASFRHSAGILGRIWRRQYGKSFVLGSEAIDVMLAQPGITTVFMSASLRLGKENLLKEAEVWRTMVRKLRAGGTQISTNADDDKGDILDIDAIADLFDHSQLEVKIWHDNVTYSRSIVIAPNPDTAVGFTGWLFLDEVGRMPMFRDVWEAAEPFAASSPDFKIRLSTTPPPDDSHYSYEILAPPVDSVFPVNEKGNFYRSSAGYLMHRLDAYDGEAGGVHIFDSETRETITPEDARAKAWDKDAWDRNFGVKFLRNTGQSAIASGDLAIAQEIGRDIDVGEAVALFEQLPDAGPELEALVRSYLSPDWTDRIGKGRIGLGLDIATSDGKVSNPSSITVTEKDSIRKERLTLAFKSADEAVTEFIVSLIIDDLERANKKAAIRGLSIDASNEVFFAQNLSKKLRRKGIAVRLIKGGENMTHRGSTASSKIVTGNLYSNLYSEQGIAISPEEWIAEDRRLVRRVAGSFAAAVLPDGRHADTFDSGKLANWELERGGNTSADAAQVGGGTQKEPRPGLKNPFIRFFQPKNRRGY